LVFQKFQIEKQYVNTEDKTFMIKVHNAKFQDLEEKAIENKLNSDLIDTMNSLNVITLRACFLDKNNKIPCAL
jgi:hypothetical protein